MIETGKVNKKFLDNEEYSDIDDSLLFFHKNNHNTNKELSCNNRKIIFSTNIFPHKKIYKGKVNKSLRKNLNKTIKDQRIEQSFNIKNQNEKEKIFIKKFQLENDEEKLIDEIYNKINKMQKKEENNLNYINKEINGKLTKYNKELKNERNNLNLINNNRIKKNIDNINNELDKGKSREYLKRNEFKELIKSILNDILIKLNIEN